jgi:hypothetical protein
MMGSVGERMKEDIMTPLNWVVRSKFLKRKDSERNVDQLESPFTPQSGHEE